jgi:hypothetical protein
MTPQEINRAIAEKVMGTTVHGMSRVIGETWNPAERIDHAWLVVDRMKESGWKFHLADGMFGMNYLCAFYRGSHSDSLQADTAPMAICLAALEAVNVTVE